MSRVEIVIMFLVAQALALWGLWDIPSVDVNGQALMLAFMTMEGFAIIGWLIMAFVISPGVVWAVDKVTKRKG